MHILAFRVLVTKTEVQFKANNLVELKLWNKLYYNLLLIYMKSWTIFNMTI